MSGARYVGDGAWLPGVPARDLSAAEVERFGEVIAGSGLYELSGSDVTATAVGPRLTDVQGIGAKTALALAEAGYGTLAALASADPALVDAAMDGVLDYVTTEKVRQWQAAAQALVAQVGEGDEVDHG